MGKKKKISKKAIPRETSVSQPRHIKKSPLIFCKTGPRKCKIKVNKKECGKSLKWDDRKGYFCPERHLLAPPNFTITLEMSALSDEWEKLRVAIFSDNKLPARIFDLFLNEALKEIRKHSPKNLQPDILRIQAGLLNSYFEFLSSQERKELVNKLQLSSDYESSRGRPNRAACIKKSMKMVYGGLNNIENKNFNRDYIFRGKHKLKNIQNVDTLHLVHQLLWLQEYQLKNIKDVDLDKENKKRNILHLMYNLTAAFLYTFDPELGNSPFDYPELLSQGYENIWSQPNKIFSFPSKK